MLLCGLLIDRLSVQLLASKPLRAEETSFPLQVTISMLELEELGLVLHCRQPVRRPIVASDCLFPDGT